MGLTLSRRHLAVSSHPAIRLARAIRSGFWTFTLPAPRIFAAPSLLVLSIRGAVLNVAHFLWRVLVCEPVFKAQCKEFGTGVRTDICLHSIQGKGDIIVGNDVLVDGQCHILFAARYSDAPTLAIGDHSGIGHRCSFTIGKRITIGRHCRIASEVMFFDSPGHPLDPEKRQAGVPAADEDVKPITIEDNVWIGRRCTIYPGVTIGEGSVVSTGSVVTNDVPPYTLVTGNPARRVMVLQAPSSPSDTHA